MSINLYDNVPPDWLSLPLKRTITAIKGGVWGEEPDGISDLSVVRVADIDRQSLRVRDSSFTVRAISLSERKERLLTSGDLLIEKSGGGDQQLVGMVVSFNHEVEAVCSNFMAALKPADSFDSRFLVYLHSYLYGAGVTFQCIKQTTGIQNIDLEDYLSTYALIPPLNEQRRISAFLDHETARLDTLIAEKQNLLELLTEKRRTLISSAVTRGINPKVKRKNSGYSWLGEIPEHWEVERSKWLFKERDIRSEFGDEEMLTVSHITGVTTRAAKNVNMFLAESQEGSKICEAGDLVINTLWAWMGAMGVSPQRGIVSPAYNVYEPCERLDKSYLDYLVRMPVFAQEAIRFSKGVWSSRLRLYPEGLYEIWFPVPPVEEQRAIAEYLAIETKKIDALQEATYRTIALLRERRTALIATAVTGKIDLPSELNGGFRI